MPFIPIEHLAIELGIVLLLGFAAQWLAWRFAIPSILLLLVFGFLSGPVFHIIHTDEIFGELVSPLVSVAVGIILFEGGLTLKLIELRNIGKVVWRLNSIGALVTWALTSIAAHSILQLTWPISLQLGAILVVTGPTVIGPLLRHVGNVGAAGIVLKWEGILIDPVGATLALLVYEGIRASTPNTSVAIHLGDAAFSFVQTVLVGGLIGVAASLIVVLALRRHLIPDFLQNPFTLTMVVTAFALSDMLQHESGLLATTVMGIALSNAREVDAQHILEFKENLVVLFISMLFIILSSQLSLGVLREFDLQTGLFLLVLLVIIRPLSVFVSSLGSALSRRERLFVAWLAPRGIVAAAVAALFGQGLVEAGYEGAERLEPLVFLTIVGTVLVYGLTAVPVARWLGVAQKRRGIVIAGAQGWARRLAMALREAGQEVLMVDNNVGQIHRAQQQGISAIQGNILSEFTEDKAELANMGVLLAVTANDEVNALATLHFADRFGKASVYQLSPELVGEHGEFQPPTLRGQILFNRDLTFAEITRRFADGATFKTIRLDARDSLKTFQQEYGERAIPLFAVNPDGELAIFTTSRSPSLQPGQQIISLIIPENAAGVATVSNGGSPPQATRAG